MSIRRYKSIIPPDQMTFILDNINLGVKQLSKHTGFKKATIYYQLSRANIKPSPPIIDNRIKQIPTIPPGNFTGWRTVYCSKFGCGKVLTVTEQLCGKHCIDHQRRVRADAAKITKHG